MSASLRSRPNFGTAADRRGVPKAGHMRCRGQHRFHRMDIHAPRCLNMGAASHGGTIMKKLSMLGIVGGAALLAAVPFSLQWSQGNVGPAVPLLTLTLAVAPQGPHSLGTIEARRAPQPITRHHRRSQAY